MKYLDKLPFSAYYEYESDLKAQNLFEIRKGTAMNKTLKWTAWKSMMTARLPIYGTAMPKLNRFTDPHISVLESVYQE
jgi:hypothetical protein